MQQCLLGPAPNRLLETSKRRCEGSRPLSRLRGNSGAAEHPPQVDDLLLVDIVTSRSIERLGLRSQRHRVPTIVLLGDSADALEES